jgi:hypothetical protein
MLTQSGPITAPILAAKFLVSDSVDWTETTFEGNRMRQHNEFMALSFREKMIRVEEMCEVARLLSRVPPTADRPAE